MKLIKCIIFIYFFVPASICSAQQIEVGFGIGGSRVISGINLSHIDKQLELSDGYHLESTVKLLFDKIPVDLTGFIMWNSFHGEENVFVTTEPIFRYESVLPDQVRADVLVQTLSTGLGLEYEFYHKDLPMRPYAGLKFLYTYYSNMRIDATKVVDLVYVQPDMLIDPIIYSPLEKEWRFGACFDFGTYFQLSHKVSLWLSGSYIIFNLNEPGEIRTAGYTRGYFPESELDIGQLYLGVHYKL